MTGARVEVAAPEQWLRPVDLPSAPPVVRAPAPSLRRPKLPATGLVVLGALMVLGPIVGGLFAKVAAGRQMVAAFAPHMDPDAFARYDTDLQVLRRGAEGVAAVYDDQHIATGRFSRLDQYRQQWPEIDARTATLLARVKAAQPDYQEVAAIGGLDRMPFLIVIAGMVALYGGCVLVGGNRARAKPTIVLVVVASAAVVAFPVASSLDRGAAAGHRMLGAFAPIMNRTEVRQLQSDFVVIVEAVGELDTGFRQVPQTGAAAPAIASLVQQWPEVSSDLASLVGTINDNIHDFHALSGLDRLTQRLGLSGLEAFPWVLAALAVTATGLSMASWPRGRKETAP